MHHRRRRDLSDFPAASLFFSLPLIAAGITGRQRQSGPQRLRFHRRFSNRLFCPCARSPGTPKFPHLPPSHPTPRLGNGINLCLFLPRGGGLVVLLLRKELVSLEEKDSTTVSSSTCLAVPFLKPLLPLFPLHFLHLFFTPLCSDLDLWNTNHYASILSNGLLSIFPLFHNLLFLVL